MATYSNYRYSSPEAWRLADLHGIEQDLLAVISYCKYMQQQSDASKYDYVLLEAMGTAALIRYARCFAKGVRVRLGSEMFQDAELVAKHEYFIHMRNKHVAHSVNPFEDNAVTVYIGSHYASSQEIQHIGVAQVVILAMGMDDFAVLSRLAGYVLEKVRSEMGKEKIRLLELVRREPIKGFISSGMLTLGPGDVKANVNKRRKK